MGPPERASACEQPMGYEAVLSFDDKYKHGGKKLGRGGGRGRQAPSAGMAGQRRQVPAPIGDALTAEVQGLGHGRVPRHRRRGVVRVDFLYQAAKKRLLLNEINTTPGSLSYYLWEEEGSASTSSWRRWSRSRSTGTSEQRATVYSFAANC
jgi:D-alanine-D-alanine ligase